MYMCLQASFAIPSEGAISEVDMYAKHFFERFPYRCNLLSLCDGIGGDKSCVDVSVLHHLGSLVIPSSYVVYLASCLIWFALFIHENIEQVSFLLLALQ